MNNHLALKDNCLSTVSAVPDQGSSGSTESVSQDVSNCANVYSELSASNWGAEGTADRMSIVAGTQLFGNFQRRSSFVSLQKWEGVVLEVLSDSILCRLHDMTTYSLDEETEISFEELSEDDLALARQGAVFYWNIGYHDSRTGQRTRQSVIRFRRLPAWTAKELDNAKREAVKLKDTIGWK